MGCKEKRMEANDIRIRLLRRCAGDCSFGHPVASRLWAPHDEFVSREGLLVNSGTFYMPIFETNLSHGAIGQAPYFCVFLSAIIVAIHNRSPKSKSFDERCSGGAVNNRKNLVAIKDIEIGEILVDKQLFRRWHDLIPPIIPNQKQPIKRRASEGSVAL